MKNKNGFTLVELLAVISILAVLVILVVPNVLKLFNDSKKSAFETEVKNIYSAAEKEYVNDSLNSSGNKVYSFCKNGDCGKTLNLSGGKDIEYYIEFDSSGKVTKYYATNGSYQYRYTGLGLKIADINNIEFIPDLSEDNIVEITKNGNAADLRSFATDSWSKIQQNVRNNNLSYYHIGDTKEVDMSEFGVHTVRISNMSTPDVCSSPGFSQTGCGFVVEFADIITRHRMNPFTQNGNVNGDGNRGGWEYSEIRQYVNNDIYNALPADLKNVITDTYVVSGHGAKDADNFITTDKLYYLATVEVDGKVNNRVTESSVSRQLDYYTNYGSNAKIAIKNNGDSPGIWCFRTAAQMPSYPQYYNIFHGIRTGDGWVEKFGACDGVSPAFRIE